jgi:hypothetical protein
MAVMLAGIITPFWPRHKGVAGRNFFFFKGYFLLIKKIKVIFVFFWP